MSPNLSTFLYFPSRKPYKYKLYTFTLNKKRKTISFGVLRVGFPSEKLFVTNPY